MRPAQRITNSDAGSPSSRRAIARSTCREVELTGVNQAEAEGRQKQILTSMVERYDQAVYEVLAGIAGEGWQGVMSKSR